MEHVLKQVVQDVFEQMYFMFLQEAPPESLEQGGSREAAWARVGVLDGRGSLVIGGTDGLVREMAANMCGSEKEASPAELEDVIREAANIVAGNFVNEGRLPGGISPDIEVSRSPISDFLNNKNNELSAFFVTEGEIFLALVSGVDAPES